MSGWVTLSVQVEAEYAAICITQTAFAACMYTFPLEEEEEKGCFRPDVGIRVCRSVRVGMRSAVQYVHLTV